MGWGLFQADKVKASKAFDYALRIMNYELI